MPKKNKNDINEQEIDCSTAEFDALDEQNEVSATVATQSAINRRKLEQAIATQDNIWGYSSIGIEAKKAAMTMLSTKTGLYSRVPLVCKGHNCPYKDSCGLIPYDLAPIGEYCPIETSQIEISIQKYVNEFDIREEDFTDQNILKEIVNLEIMIERCKALMAKEQNPIIEVTTGVTEDGTEYTHPEVSKAFEIYERCQKTHSSLLSLMNATRKDKKGMVSSGSNPISEIFSKMSELEKNGGFVNPQRPEGFIVIDNNNES